MFAFVPTAVCRAVASTTALVNRKMGDGDGDGDDAVAEGGRTAEASSGLMKERKGSTQTGNAGDCSRCSWVLKLYWPSETCIYRYRSSCALPGRMSDVEELSSTVDDAVC